jgi:hypothetical protein
MCNHHKALRSSNKDLQEIEKQLDRRTFLKKTSMGIGALALGSLLNADNVWGSSNTANSLENSRLDKINTNNYDFGPAWPHNDVVITIGFISLDNCSIIKLVCSII